MEVEFVIAASLFVLSFRRSPESRKLVHHCYKITTAENRKRLLFVPI